ncbi:MAG: cytochrome c biogenesis protein CcsA [Gammaproteobacteria bacterium]|nr:cytochrome c biogenesis protein CcsA [Gammaproteobacteria bacterium]MCF6362952.1 cytochrome c biogenesis protein CcsA [Gammaproteobacteria bacterium]
MSHYVIAAIATALYFMTGFLLAKRLFRGGGIDTKPGKFSKNHIILIGLIAVLLHAVLLYQSLFVPEGLNIGFINAISLITWLIALLLLLAAVSNPVENLGIILLPLAGLAILAEVIFPSEHTLMTAQAMELKLHILMSVLAYSLLSIAAGQALLLAVQDNHLRNKRPGGFIRALPPLQTMETLLFQMIGLGLALLTASLLTGTLYIEDMFAQHLVHKTILSMVAWVVFAILLWGRWRFGWRGRTAIRWTLSGFVVLLLAYIGSKLVIEIILDL